MNKILIGVPCHKDLTKDFVAHLPNLQLLSNCDIYYNNDGTVYNARDAIATHAIANGYEYVFFVDADMILPDDALVRMLSDAKDMVSGLYFKRVYPYEPVIYSDFKPRTGSVASCTAIKEYQEELFEIAGAGMGCCLIKTQVFKEVLNRYQCMHELLPALGEDFSFFMRARELGYKLYCDPTVKCGHVAQVVVTEDWFKRAKQYG